MISTETPTCIISIKIVTQIFAAERFTRISVAETFNCIIATETVTFIITRIRSTNISVAEIESTTNIIAIKLKTCKNGTDIGTCIIAIENVSSIVPTETATCRIDYRNFNLQKL